MGTFLAGLASLLRLIFSDKGWGTFFDLVLASNLWESLGGAD